MLLGVVHGYTSRWDLGNPSSSHTSDAIRRFESISVKFTPSKKIALEFRSTKTVTPEAATWAIEKVCWNYKANSNRLDRRLICLSRAAHNARCTFRTTGNGWIGLILDFRVFYASKKKIPVYDTESTAT
jgi:phenylpropionate dioxygenase-like ring-hydroxylating dioxygenase large terminal subunit